MTSLTSTNWPKNALPENLITWLFGQMLSKWGKAFVDKWSVVDDKVLRQDWGKALYGITELEWRRGIAKMNDFPRPMSLPEFLKACRPEINPLNAYYEALEGCRSRERGEMGTWSHPAIFWASVRVSAHDLKSQTYSQIRERWEQALKAELQKNQWEDIKAPMIALPAPVKRKLSREEVGKFFKSLKACYGGADESSSDPKRWAHLILQRHRNGDKKLTALQIQFAKDALKIEEEICYE